MSAKKKSLAERVAEWNATPHDPTGSLEVGFGNARAVLETPARAGACAVCGQRIAQGGGMVVRVYARSPREDTSGWAPLPESGRGSLRGTLVIHPACADPINFAAKLAARVGLDPGSIEKGTSGVSFPAGYRRTPKRRAPTFSRRYVQQAIDTADPSRIRFTPAKSRVGGRESSKARQQARAALIEGLKAKGVEVPEPREQQ